MHLMVALGIVAGLIGFAFGETAARIAVGAALICTALFFGGLFLAVMTGVIG